SEGFALTEADYAAKQAIRDHGLLENFAKLTEGVDYSSNEMIFLADSEEYAKAVAAAYGAELKSFEYGVAVLDMSGSKLSIGDAYALAADADVALPVVEPNYLYKLNEPEADQNTTEAKKNKAVEWKLTQWEDFGRYDPLLDPADPNFQWWHQYIDTYGAWGVFEDSYKPHLGDDIKVAVIDTGVNANHEELRGHVTTKDIGQGVEDKDGHGSHVAGLIGAAIANHHGGAGIAPGVQIIGICAENNEGYFSNEDEAKAIQAAVDEGVSVINMSIGGPLYSDAVAAKCESAYNAGVTVVASAGNEAMNGYSYPAAYDHVISVGASEEGGNKTQFSNFGDWVDVMAPGANMRSCYKGGNDMYINMQGTSQAGPLVAGACALYMSACGKVAPDVMESILKKSTKKCNTAGACQTGIINVAKMFDGDATAPQIDMLGEDGTASISTAQSGSFEACASTVKGSQYIEFTGKGFNGDEEGNQNTSYIVTVNGKVPDPRNYCSITYSGRYNYKNFLVGTGSSVKVHVGQLLWVSDDYNLSEKTITVKAIAVTGRGVISGVTTMQVAVDPEVRYNLSISGGPNEETFAQGTEAQLHSYLRERSEWSRYSQTLNHDSTTKWSIESNNGCGGTSIDSSTGKLTIGASDAGSFTVKAESTTYNDVVGYETFYVKKRAAVTSVELAEDTQGLISDDLVIVQWGDVQPEVKLKMTLADGTTITSDLPKVNYSSTDWLVADIPDKKEAVSGNSIDVIYPRSKGTCTITGTVQDGSNTQFSFNVSVKALIYDFIIYGQNEVAQGKSVKFRATPRSHTQKIYYNDAKIYKKYGLSDKRFTWQIRDVDGRAETAISGVTIDKKGKLKVAASVPVGTTFSVAAVAVEGGSVTYAPMKVTGASNNITITTVDANPDPAYDVKINKKGSVTSVQLFIRNISNSSVDESSIKLKAVADNGATVYWMRNNYNTWYDDNYEDGVIRINSYSYKANSVYTAYVLDGTKKKAKVKVRVIVPVASMQITAPGLETGANPAAGSDRTALIGGITTTLLSSGYSAKLKVEFGDEYGKATKKKVKWEATPVKVSEGVISEAPELAGKFSFKNGKLKLKNDFNTTINNNVGVLVTATTTDGTCLTVSKIVLGCKKTTKLSYVKSENGYLHIESDGSAGVFEIRSSAPEIKGLKLIDDATWINPDTGNLVFVFAGYNPKNLEGNWVITIKAKDGSNRSISFTGNK
ncbi:MAG: S8 family serine peptidase, partial [Lachnospiraceae bacterium]|nr:S8 family serine peptidase [Lachnospiraceae bacterium]